MTTTSSSSTSFFTHPIMGQQPLVVVSIDEKTRACQRLRELFGLTIPATEQECFEAAWEKCKERDWTLLKRCQEELNHIFNEQGCSLLQQAIRIGEIALATEMIANGITIHARDSIGNTAMHYAVQTESLHLVSTLYQHISQDAQNVHGQTPMHFAAARGQLDIIRAMIANGANLSASTQEPIHGVNSLASLSIGDLTLPNLTPLAFAAIRGDRDCVDLFLSENQKNPALNLNLRFGTMGNLVHLLITFHHIHLLKFLLTKHDEKIFPLLEERNPRGLTPLMLAAYLGEKEALVLLRDKVNLEGTDFYGRTAVHYAVLGRQKNSLAYLHSFGVNLMALDANNKIPLSLIDELDDSESQSVVGYLSNLCKLKAKAQHAPPNFMADSPENLVFKGNDPTGFSYLGVIQALEMNGTISGIKRVTGPSTGALIATLVAVGCSFEEMVSKVRCFSSFFDCPIAGQAISAIPKSVPQAATLQRLCDIIQNNSPLGKDQFKTLHQLPSLCSGKALLEWIEGRIYEKTGIHDCTFGELNELRRNRQFKHLTVITTCFGNTLTLSRFSSEDTASADIVISHAVCAALSVPGIFPLKSLHCKNKTGGVDVAPSLGLHGDAALINNFSIEAYDQEKYQSVMPLGGEAGEYFRLNKRTLGFALETQMSKCSIPETATVKQFLEKVLSFYCQLDPSMQQQTLYNRSRVVQIQNLSEGLSSFTPEERMKKIIAIGHESTAGFFEEQERVASLQNPFMNHLERTNQGIKWTNLKSPLSYFVGRTQQIQTLREKLVLEQTHPSTSSSNSNDSSPHPIQTRACMVLAGAGGMGKSETAIAFAHQYRDSFSVVWWVDSATPQTMDRSFRQLADVLDIYIEPTSSEETIRHRIYYFLKTENLGKPYLLIFDNAEDSVELPEGNNGRILITTTQPSHFLLEDILPIESFTVDEAINLVAGILKEDPNEEMSRLAAEVEYLPAILSQAAQYIRTTPGMTLHKYLDLLSKEKIEVLSLMPVDSRYSKAQLSTWKMTHETLMQRHPIAYEWLQICAYLQPDAIPSFYLETWLECFKGEQDYVARSFKRDLILRTLVNSGILRYHQQTDSYSLHRIRQEMIKQLLLESNAVIAQNRSSSSPSSSISESSSASSRQTALALLAAIVKKLDLEINDPWSAILPHEAQICAILDSSRGQTDESEEIASLCYTLGRLRLFQLRINEGRELFVKALNIRTELQPFDQLDIERQLAIARTMDSLAEISYSGLHHFSSMQIVKQLHRAAYKIRKRLFQNDHVEMALSLLNMRDCYDNLSRHHIKYESRAMEMLSRLYPDGHRLIARELLESANTMVRWNELDQAYEKALEALKMLERIYPWNCLFNNPDMGEVLELLAYILKKQEKKDEALIYYKKAIEIHRNIYPNHPRLFRCFMDAAPIAQDDDAWKYYESAAKMLICGTAILPTWGCLYSEIGGGPNDEKLVQIFFRIPFLNLNRSNLTEVLDFFTQYITSYTKQGNEDNIAWTLLAIGLINYKLGNHDIALTQIEHLLSKNPEKFWAVIKNLVFSGVMHHNLGKHEEAVQNFRRAIEIWKRFKDSGFIRTDISKEIRKCLPYLRDSLNALGRHEEAQVCFDEVSIALQVDLPSTDIQLAESTSASTRSNPIGLSSSSAGQQNDMVEKNTRNLRRESLDDTQRSIQAQELQPLISPSTNPHRRSQSPEMKDTPPSNECCCVIL